MDCKSCGRIIPDGLLGCPACVEKRSRVAVLAFQLGPLRRVAAGRSGLIIRAITGKRHIQMFGTEQTYCGQPISPGHRRSLIPYNTDELNTICSGCRIELTRLMEEACLTSASE